MKHITLLVLAFGLSALTALAQDGPRGPGGRRGPGGPRGGERPPTMPVIAALDANTNNIIEAGEIANASAALLKLDKDGDGKLSVAELQPQRSGSSGNQQPFPQRERDKRPVLPIMKALDSNSDGELDASEIANASTALKTLDTNGDGQLTMDELMPKPPEGFGGRNDGGRQENK